MIIIMAWRGAWHAWRVALLHALILSTLLLLYENQIPYHQIITIHMSKIKMETLFFK